MAASPREILHEPLTLPCGVTLKNRLAKGAMTEGLADAQNRPTARHERLYRMWAEGGCGMLLTGNVQINRKHLEAAGNVVIEGKQSPEQLEALRRYAQAAQVNDTRVFMQISHAGRQTPKAINPSPKAPSAHTVNLPGGRFGLPVPMTELEILDAVAGFAHAAVVARETGFDGVQIHAAHGYLISSFLSPKSNTRNDGWGGSLEGRARILLEAVRHTRAAVGRDYPISVKINSADFQRGGFSFEDSQTVVRWLDEAGVDLIEISGGSYEQPSMMNLEGSEKRAEPKIAASTRAREAYFQKFAPEIRRNISRAKLMVTGGFRSAAGMASAISEDGVDLIGIARPLCFDPAGARKLLEGHSEALDMWESRLRIGPGLLGPNSPIAIIKALNGFGAMSWYYEQIKALADGGAPKPNLGLIGAFMAAEKREKAKIAALAA